MSMRRRDFLVGGLSAGGASLMAGRARAAPEDSTPDLPIVDTHQHLWDLQLFQPPWLETASPLLRRSYVTADYLAATKGLNLVRAVYMEVHVKPADLVREAEHVMRLCQDPAHPTCAAVIGGRPNSPEFRDYLLKYRDNRLVKGIRQVLHPPQTPRGFCLQPTFVSSMRLLGECGKSMDLCMRPAELSDGLELAKQCPDTRFIIDHCGNADPKAFLQSPPQPAEHAAESWKRDMGRLAQCQNVVCKISGIVARATEDWDAQQLAPIVNHCLQEFGPERVLFGSDWPVCRVRAPLRKWVTALQQIVADRPLAQQRQLFHDNAVRLYDLG